MRMRETAIAIFVAAGMSLAAAGSATAADKIKVTFAAASSIYAPYFNAIQQGYYKDEGIEIEIIKAGGGVATPGLISGKVDFSTSASSAVSAMLRGAPLKVIYTAADRPSFELWTTSDQYKTLQSLKGKQVGIQTRGDTFEIWLRLVLRSQGMRGDDVGYTPLGYGSSARVAAVKTGSLPAVVLSTLDVSAMKSAGIPMRGHMLVDGMTSDIRMMFNGIATSEALIKKNPDLVSRVARATLKGMRFMRAFRDATIANVVKYNKQTVEATRVDYDDAIRTLTKDGTISESVQEAETSIRAQLIKLPQNKIPPLSKLFDFSFMQKAAAELDARGWKPTK
jgi:ABC-type nitrate/sulfonate/bicarbonate transport system substrate-binding protein